ncbi:helix-turn-helix domain-containing protein [Roseicitreum antarcticum]|uniref:HTH DNA binding domain-containing protein n=1 Tax=Roseicitreum antarcticum TaxID=564137 RepID=A0A1H2RTP8_9RHOB|nr:helix-turn-helix domain-containing protein [Roseicitreum antarcticum]SDW22801.1 HTH DNA binding domain-containing protein [Roseicitreum antarcticum]
MQNDTSAVQPDPDDSDEASLWFLPGPVEDEDATTNTSLPWPVADQTDLLDSVAWQRAEATQAVALARAAAVLGALDERLRASTEGLRQRLGLLEVTELSWHAGDRIPADRLALYHALRLSGAQTDSLALARAGWAYRRLTSGPGPIGSADGAPVPSAPADPSDAAEIMGQSGSPSALDAFLGRKTAPDSPDPDTRQWQALLNGAHGLHSLTAAAMCYHAGRIIAGTIGMAGREMIEAAVVAARMAARDTRGGLMFVPLALGGVSALQARGSIEERLTGWYIGVERSGLAALMHLDRLAEWHARVTRATAHLSGRTPPQLVQVLADWPLVSAAMAEAQTGASRAAVQRNLAMLENEGLIREVTGQGRYRFWTAAL